MTLGSTHFLTEMSTTNLHVVVKGGQHVRLTTSPPSAVGDSISKHVNEKDETVVMWSDSGEDCGCEDQQQISSQLREGMRSCKTLKWVH
jgi:hypothetical protein